MLLSLKQFQIAVLEERESMQQSISDEHNFYEWVKEVNQINRKLK